MYVPRWVKMSVRLGSPSPSISWVFGHKSWIHEIASMLLVLYSSLWFAFMYFFSHHEPVMWKCKWLVIYSLFGFESCTFFCRRGTSMWKCILSLIYSLFMCRVHVHFFGRHGWSIWKCIALYGLGSFRGGGNMGQVGPPLKFEFFS